MKLNLLATLSILPFLLTAQPTFQISWAPQPGDTWKQSITNEVFDFGPSGVNVLWDFSAATLSAGNSLEFIFIDPSDGIQTECFPESTVAADLVLDGFGSGFNYGYYAQSENSFFSWGDANDFGSKTIYDDPQEFKFIGLQFNESTTDEYHGMVESDFLNQEIFGVTSYHYDAYGTVKLPLATFNDVARIHQIDVTVDTSTIGGLLIVNIDSLESYAFMAQGSIFPIAIWQKNKVYEETIIGGVSSGLMLENESLTFSVNPDFGIVSSTKKSGTSLAIQVNPTIATNQINICGEIKKLSAIQIFDLQGRHVRSVKMAPNRAVDCTIIDVSEIQNGAYVLTAGSHGVIGRFQKY